MTPLSLEGTPPIMAGTANSIITTQALRAKNAVCVAAKTTFSDATNALKLMDAGASGSVLYKLTALARATVALTPCYLFRSPDDGVTMYLIGNCMKSAFTIPTTTVAQTLADFGFTETSPLRLMVGDSLWVGIGVALAGGIVFDGVAEDL